MRLNLRSGSTFLIIAGIILIAGGIFIFLQANLQPTSESSKLVTNETRTSLQFIEKQYPAPFLNKGWIRNIKIEYSTYNQDFVINKKIFFTIQVDITKPVKDFTVNIFNEKDKFYFTNPPVDQLKYPSNLVYRFSYPGEMFNVNLKPIEPFNCNTDPNDPQVDNQDNPCLYSYFLSSTNTTFTEPGKYFANFVILQENDIPLNYTAPKELFDLPSQKEMDLENTIAAVKQNVNQTSTQTIEKIESNDKKSELMIIGSILIPVGVALCAIGISKKDIFAFKKEERKYRKLQEERIQLLFQLDNVRSDLRSFPNTDNDPDLAPIESELHRREGELVEKLRILDGKINQFHGQSHD